MSDQQAALIAIVGTVVTGLIGLVSWTQRALLSDIQTSLRAILAGQTSVSEAVRVAGKQTDDRLDRLSRAIELSARVDLLRLIGSPEIRSDVKQQAKGLIQEIHDAAEGRG